MWKRRKQCGDGKLLAFSMGLLTASILPPCWVVVVVAVVLIISSLCGIRCRRI
ncbi:MAG: hypothetical protein II735_01930 [Clostridia bacterium]|nr:hypothetical protein [Clostridia bacterium]